MKFAKLVFGIAGLYGLVAVMPMYFLVDRIGIDSPPAITHLVFFYGFAGIALAWQLVFLLISRQPSKYRLLMIPAMMEKLAFGVPAILLYRVQAASASELVFGFIDLTLFALFAVAFFKTRVA